MWDSRLTLLVFSLRVYWNWTRHNSHPPLDSPLGKMCGYPDGHELVFSVLILKNLYSYLYLFNHFSYRIVIFATLTSERPSLDKKLNDFLLVISHLSAVTM